MVAGGSVAGGFVAGGFVAGGFVAGGFVAGGFVAGGFVAGGVVAGGFVAGGLVAGGFVAGGLVTTLSVVLSSEPLCVAFVADVLSFGTDLVVVSADCCFLVSSVVGAAVFFVPAPVFTVVFSVAFVDT